jgi:uncharacterized protein (TIGR02145 family)
MKVLIGFLFLFSINLTFSQLYTPGSEVTDVDGNNYPTININGQEWMAENLRTSKYANGDPIPNVTDNSQWSFLTTGAWVHQNNDSLYEITYGKLYNWQTVADSRNVCPTGWYVPSDINWFELANYLGGTTVAGGKMKSTGTIESGTGLWNQPNLGATNEGGFSGIPGGYRTGDGTFEGTFELGGWVGAWWSSSEFDVVQAGIIELVEFDEFCNVAFDDKRNGLSIRCMRESTSGLNLINPSPKKLVKILNTMGQETSVKTNEILFYLYDDGSIEKKITVN